MTREEIVALFDRREGYWRSRDAAALAHDHAPNGVVISPTGGVLEGRDDIERIYRVWFTAFADFAFTVEDLIVEGELGGAGGVGPDVAGALAAAGANAFVAGTSVFKGGTQEAYKTNIAAIRNAAAGARGEAI